MGKYWFASLGGGDFAIGTGDQEIATTPSWDVAQRITEALNAMGDGEPKRFVVRNRLKEWRLRRDLTQAQLADLVGVAQGTIGKYETAKLGIDLDVLERFANALQVDPSQLITDGDKP